MESAITLKKNPNPPRGAIKLRHQAEAQLQDQSTQADPSPATAVKTLRLIHELQVHQIELELQNRELLETRIQLEQSLEKYTDLYDFAPTGYFVLAANGIIQEANLAGAALLGQERSRLLGRRFGLFVSMETRTAFNVFLDAALASPSKVCAEVTLAPEGVPPHHLHLEGAGVQFSESPRCRIAAIDIRHYQKHKEPNKNKCLTC